MKLEATLQQRPGASAQDNPDTPVNQKQLHDLRKISRLRPAKLTAGRGGLGGARRSRKTREETPSAEPVVVLAESREGLGAAEIEAMESYRASGPRGDNLQLYLREIGQVRLLTPAEEIE